VMQPGLLTDNFEILVCLKKEAGNWPLMGLIIAK
jgi:hypothetical protein